jgi:deazaflavin-dependent oxidoreductase (nitroreductase family)
MVRRIRDAGPPTGLRRLLFRAPVYLYRWHLGGLLGRRFLLLTHIGRVSGQPRQNVLEVAGHDTRTGSYDVASGFGTRSQWYRNVHRRPEVTIQVGRRVMSAVAEPLSAEESSRAMVRYARRNPAAARQLTKLCGFRVDGSTEDYAIVGREHIPFVRFRPRPATRSSPM